MIKKGFAVIVGTLMLLSTIFVSAGTVNDVVMAGPVHNIDTDEYFNTIQEAIDDPDTVDGHTIEVAAGTYFENVVIDKRITLIGENRDTTFIDGGNTDDVIRITADWVNITQFSIQDGGDSGPHPIFESGIELNGVQNCKIAYNKISKSMVGINFKDSYYNTIENNNIYYNNGSGPFNGWGIHVGDSNNNIIANNTIHNNEDSGITLNGGVNNNTLCNNVIYSNGDKGIYLCDCDNNIIFENTISDNQYGFYLKGGPNNNFIFHNNILNNTIQASDTGKNMWDNGYPSGGNYWSDYNGTDVFSGVGQNISGNDGVGDTPYLNINGFITTYVAIEVINETVHGPATAGETGPIFLDNGNITNCSLYLFIPGDQLYYLEQPANYTINNTRGEIDTTPIEPYDDGWIFYAYYNYTEIVITQAQDNYPLMAPWGTDTTPPTIISTTPANNETNVSVGSDIVVLFSEPMNKTSAENAFQIYPNVNGTFSWNGAGDEMTFSPSEPMMELKEYLVHVDLSAKDLAGNGLVSDKGAEIEIIFDNDQHMPKIYDDKIVYQDDTSGNFDIYMYNISTSERTIICDNLGKQVYPHIFANYIVWMDNRNGPWQVYCYDISNNTEYIICNSTNVVDDWPDITPRIHDNIVVWHDLRNGNKDIYGYNLISGLEFPICTSVFDQSFPSVFEDKVVWGDMRNGNWDIYIKNLTTGVESPICTIQDSQGLPSIHGDIIAWQDARFQSVNVGDIYCYEISSGTEYEICKQPEEQGYVDNFEDIIVWQDRRNNSWVIYYNSINTATETALTWGSKPDIWNNFIVWQDNRNWLTTGWDIYLYCLPHAWTFTTGEAEEPIVDWPMFGHDPQRTGYIDSDAPDTNETAWVYEGPPITKIESPAVVEGVVYITRHQPPSTGGIQSDSVVMALNSSTGVMIWECVLPQHLVSSPAIFENKLYLRTWSQSSHGDCGITIFLCYDTNTGDIIWNTTIPTYAVGLGGQNRITYPIQAPLVVNGKVYGAVARYINTVYDYSTVFCMNAENGAILWDKDFNYLWTTAQIAYSNGKLFLSGGPIETGIFSLDAENGNTIWIFNESNGFESTPTIDDGLLYACNWDGDIWCLDKSNGNPIWNRSFGGFLSSLSSPSISDDKIFLSYDTSTKGVMALNKSDGNILWQKDTSEIPYTSPIIANGTLYLGYIHEISAFDCETGNEVWKYYTGAGGGVYNFPSHKSLAIYDNHLFASNGGPKLICFGTPHSSLSVDLSITSDDITLDDDPIMGATVMIGATVHNVQNQPTSQDDYWLMFQNNIGNTGGSYVDTSQVNGTLKWIYDSGKFGFSSAAIGSDGTIYSANSHLYAIYPNGTEKWSFDILGGSCNSPAIDSNGTIYVAGQNNGYGYLYAINPDGTEKWFKDICGNWKTNQLRSHPTIGPNGIIYIRSNDGTLYAINPDGSDKWTTMLSGATGTTIAVAADGTIYCCGGGGLYALSPVDGSILWTYLDEFDILSDPTVGEDGTIYYAHRGLIAVNPNGTLKWNLLAEGGTTTSPAIGPDGTIYFHLEVPTDRFFAINPSGAVKWVADFGRIMYSSPAIGNEGTIYIGSFSTKKINAINPDGSVKWSYETGGEIYASPAIGNDGTVYIGSMGGKLYAFENNNQTSGQGSPLINATCTVSFYLDNASAGNLIYQEFNVSVPGGGNTTVYTNWTPTVSGNHTIIVVVSDVDPPDSNLSNNIASIDFFVQNPSTATATGPQGAGHDPIITITYDWTGTPTAVDLYYSNDTGDSWNFLGTDTSVDGSYDWGPASSPAPKPSKYYWIANAQNGADDIGIPANGTPPEAGPYNWKTHDLKINDGQPILNPSDNWELVSVPLDVSGDLRYVFDDDNWGDGGTKWDVIQWYDRLDPADPWKSYSIHRPPGANDAVIVDNTRGFWIHIINNDGDGALTVGEGSMPISTSIDLYAGWNLVSYPTETEMIVADALWGTGADKVEVFDPAEPYRIREVGPTYVMKPGEGYWVHVPADTSWVINW